jgi:competence protein ComEC
VSLLVPLAAAAVLGRLLVPDDAPAAVLLGAALAATWGALAAASHRVRALALLAVAAAMVSAAAPRLAPVALEEAAPAADGPAFGVVRWVRSGTDTTLLLADPPPVPGTLPQLGPLAGPVRLRISGRVELGPGDAVVLPSRATRAAFAGPAPGRSGEAPTVAASADELVRAALHGTPGWAAGARTRFERALDARTGTVAPILRSVVLGEAWQLVGPERDALRAIGVSHLLALSGFNLALLAWVLGRVLLTFAGTAPSLLLRLDARRAVAALVLPAIWAFTALVGWQPSVVRASLMLSAWLLARLLARRSPALDGLALAALIAFVALPAQAADPGFQLSFAAVGGLLLAVQAADDRPAWRPAARPFRRKRANTRDADATAPEDVGEPPGRLSAAASGAGRWVRAGLVASTFAALATAPIGAWHFGTVAPSSPLANLLAIPLFTFLVYPSAVLAALLAVGGAPDGLCALGAQAAAAAWTLFVRLCTGLARALPGCVEIGPDGTAGVAVVSLALGVLLLPWRPGRLGAGALLLLLAVSPADAPGSARPPAGRPPPPPRNAVVVDILDVGDAEATLVTLPDGRRILLDGGGPPDDPRGGRRAQAVLRALEERHVRRLDLIVLTHPHPDHFGGLPAVAAHVAIAELWLSPQAEAESPAGAVARWVGERERRGTRVRRTPGICGAHELGLARLEVLAPCGSAGFDVALDENDNSLVLRLSLGATDFLFAGDAGRAAEERLLAGPGLLAADVLKVAHHGSRTATTPAFLAAVRPQAAIVSAASHRPDHRGPPHAEVLERLAASGATVLQTGIDGAITVHLDARGWRLYDGRGRLRAGSDAPPAPLYPARHDAESAPLLLCASARCPLYPTLTAAPRPAPATGAPPPPPSRDWPAGSPDSGGASRRRRRRCRPAPRAPALGRRRRRRRRAAGQGPRSSRATRGRTARATPRARPRRACPA